MASQPASSGKVVSIRPSQAAKADQTESTLFVPGHDAKGHGTPIQLSLNPGTVRRINQITQRIDSGFEGRAGFIRWAIREALDRYEADPTLRHSVDLQTAVNTFDRTLGDLHYLTTLMQRKSLVREVYDQHLMDANFQAACEHIRSTISDVEGWPESPSRRDFLAWLHREFDGELLGQPAHVLALDSSPNGSK